MESKTHHTKKHHYDTNIPPHGREGSTTITNIEAPVEIAVGGCLQAFLCWLMHEGRTQEQSTFFKRKGSLEAEAERGTWAMTWAMAMVMGVALAWALAFLPMPRPSSRTRRKRRATTPQTKGASEGEIRAYECSEREREREREGGGGGGGQLSSSVPTS